MSNDKKVKPTALNTKMREELIVALNTMIKDTQSSADIKKFEEKLKEEIVKAVHKALPEKDMDVLRRYGVLKKAHDFKVQCENEDGSTYVDHINAVALFKMGVDEDENGDYHEGFEFPIDGNGYIRHRVITLNKTATKALKAWRNAIEDWNDSVKQRQNTFRSVVLGSRTYEEVVQVIPILGNFKFTSRHNLPAVLNEDTLKAIASDVIMQANAESLIKNN